MKKYLFIGDKSYRMIWDCYRLLVLYVSSTILEWTNVHYKFISSYLYQNIKSVRSLHITLMSFFTVLFLYFLYCLLLRLVKIYKYGRLISSSVTLNIRFGKIYFTFIMPDLHIFFITIKYKGKHIYYCRSRVYVVIKFLWLN